MEWLYNFLSLNLLKCFIKMDVEQRVYDSIMSEEVDMNVENKEDAGVKVEHIDYSDAFNTSQVFV